MTGKVAAAALSIHRTKPGINIDLQPYGSTSSLGSPQYFRTPIRPPIDRSRSDRSQHQLERHFRKEPIPVPMDKLHSWSTTKPLKTISGIANYSKRFTVPRNARPRASPSPSPLGEAKPINAKRETPQAPVTRPISRSAGARSRHRPRQRRTSRLRLVPPILIDITGLLKPGENKSGSRSPTPRSTPSPPKASQLRLQSACRSLRQPLHPAKAAQFQPIPSVCGSIQLGR